MRKRMKWISYALTIVLVFSMNGITTRAEFATSAMLESVDLEESVEEAITAEWTIEESSSEDETFEEIIADTEFEVESVEDVTESVTEEHREKEIIETPETESELDTMETNPEPEIMEPTSKPVAIDEPDFYEFSGLPEYAVLSAKEQEQKTELRAHREEILGMTENVDYIAGEILVAADSLESAKVYAAAFDGTLKKYAEGPGYALIVLEETADVEDAIMAASVDEVNLPAAWPNYIWSISEETIANEMSPRGVSNYDDSELGEQWFHEYIGSEWAWLYGYTGAGVSVGVVDTGIQMTHEDLKNNVLVGEYWATNDADQQGTEWTTDSNGHGTHVAGIIAADGKNGVGGSGVAPDANIKGYSVFDSSGRGSTDWVMDGFYAAIEDGHDIINMSLGGGGYDSIFQNLCEEAYEAGIFVVAAAGNESTSGTTYPACYDYVCAIGALGASGAAAAFSNFGSWVDLSFPGADIYSTYKGGDSSYRYMNGTSMASPVAAGVAAVLLSAELPELEGKTGAERVDMLETIMKSAVKKSTSSGMGKGTTSLPKALNISDEVTVPKMPEFSVAAGTYKQETLEVEIHAERGYTTIYYSMDGKTPVYKNGQIRNGLEYTGPIVIASRATTLKAIAVNASGKSSRVKSAGYILKPEQVREIALSVKGSTSSVTPGGNLTLLATFEPVYARDKAVMWTIEPKDKGITGKTGVTIKNGVVTVSKKGLVGTYIVTASMKNYDIEPATYEIQVTEQIVQSVTVTPKKATLVCKRGDTNPVLNLTEGLRVVYANGETGTAADLIWTSSNEKVASVEDGIVTAKTTGKVTITAWAKDGSRKKATCVITVKSNVMDIEISGMTEVAKGKSILLRADIQPSKASNAALKWTVEPAGCGVTVNNGKVTASGKADCDVLYKIVATTKDGTVASEPYEVRVLSGSINKISLPKEATLFTTEGNYGAETTLQLMPVITGSAGFDQTLVAYSSSMPTVATVDAKTGFVKAKAVGKTVITCKALDGSNKSAKITIRVNIPMARMKIAPANRLSAYVAKGKTLKLTILPGSDFGAPTNTKVKWSVADKTIASVDSNGRVTGKKVGTTKITAIAADGSNVNATYTVNVVKAPNYFELLFIHSSDYSNSGTLYFISDAGILKERYASGYKVDIKGPKYMGDVGCMVMDQDMDSVDLWFHPDMRGTYTIKVTLLDGSNRSATIRINR